MPRRDDLVSGTPAGIVGAYQRHAYKAEMHEIVETFEVRFTKVIFGQ